MNAIEAEMQKSLQAISKEATFHYANSRRVDWIKSNIGMVGLSGSQVRLSFPLFLSLSSLRPHRWLFFVHT